MNMLQTMVEKAKKGDIESVMRLQSGFKKATGRHIVVKCGSKSIEIFEREKRLCRKLYSLEEPAEVARC
jgi:hypothetical protein